MVALAGERHRSRVPAFGVGYRSDDCRVAGFRRSVVLVAHGNALYDRAFFASGSVAHGFPAGVDFASLRYALV